jgi:hypothetical protein
MHPTHIKIEELFSFMFHYIFDVVAKRNLNVPFVENISL